MTTIGWAMCEVEPKGESAQAKPLPSYSVLRDVSENGIEAAKFPRPITQNSVK